MKVVHFRSLKRILFVLAVAGLTTGLGLFCLKKSRGFALYKIRSSLPFNPDWETIPLKKEQSDALKAVFNQPYRFLDKGAQCYVFLSRDGRYVIKFFKLHALHPPFWLQYVHLPFHLQTLWVQKLIEKRQALIKTFTSYKIAYEEMQEQTGIVYLQLNKTKAIRQKLVLIDNLGITYSMDLSQMEFLVQKRASLFYPFLEKTIREKGLESAQKIVSDLVDFLVLRNQKEIFDKDPDLTTNFGFLEDKIIQIDIGRFRKDAQRKDPLVYHNEILRITEKFHKWLKVHYPPLSDHLEHKIASLIENGKV